MGKEYNLAQEEEKTRQGAFWWIYGGIKSLSQLGIVQNDECGSLASAFLCSPDKAFQVSETVCNFGFPSPHFQLIILTHQVIKAFQIITDSFIG